MRPPSPKGFSTLEMLIAMALLISAFTVTLLLSSSQSLSVDTQTGAEALTIARKTLETEQSLGRKDFRLVVASSSTETLNGTVYKKTIAVTQTDFFTKKVIASVSWPGTYGRSPSTSLTTLVTNFTNAVGGDTCSSVLTDSAGAHGDWSHPQIQNGAHNAFATIVNDASGVYTISDVDAYQGRLYVAVNTPAAAPSAGPNTSAATAADVAIGGGVAWSNPNNGLTANGSYSTSASTLNSANKTDYLRLTGFGFLIPASATITGIKVEIQKSRGAGGGGSVVDNEVKIVKNNVIGGTANINKADTVTSWSSANTYAVYTTDLWGETWKPADINSGTFGVAISAKGSAGGSRTAQIDNVRITITYIAQFYILNLKDQTNPTYLGSLGSNTLSVGMNAVAVATSSANHYAYLATNSTVSQLQVIDVTDPTTPVIRSTYSVPGGLGKAANSIFYSNGYVYLGLYATGANVGKEFHIIDVSNPAAPSETGFWPPTPPTGSFSTFNNDINAISVKDGYAYLATPFSPEVTVLNVTNPAAPTVAGSYDAPDTTGNGKSVYPVGDTIYLGRTVTAANPEFYSLNGTDLSQLQANNAAPITKEISSSAFGLIVRDWLASVLTTKQGVNPGQLQLFNATSTAAVATVALPGGATASGTALDCEGNYLYAASVDSLSKGYITIVTGQ